MSATQDQEASLRFLNATEFPKLFQQTIIPRLRHIRFVVDRLLNNRNHHPNERDDRLLDTWGNATLKTTIIPYPLPNNPKALFAVATVQHSSHTEGEIRATVERCTDPRVMRTARWQQKLPSGYFLNANSNSFPKTPRKRDWVKK